MGTAATLSCGVQTCQSVFVISSRHQPRVLNMIKFPGQRIFEMNICIRDGRDPKPLMKSGDENNQLLWTMLGNVLELQWVDFGLLQKFARCGMLPQNIMLLVYGA